MIIPVLVIVAVSNELLPAVEAMRRFRNVWRADRVFPKGRSNHGSLKGNNLFRTIIGHLEAARSMNRPAKVIIYSDNKEAIKIAEENLSQLTYHEDKLYEITEVRRAGDVDPNRVGFFVPECKMKEEK